MASERWPRMTVIFILILFASCFFFYYVFSEFNPRRKDEKTFRFFTPQTSNTTMQKQLQSHVIRGWTMILSFITSRVNANGLVSTVAFLLFVTVAIVFKQKMFSLFWIVLSKYSTSAIAVNDALRENTSVYEPNEAKDFGPVAGCDDDENISVDSLGCQVGYRSACSHEGKCLPDIVTILENMPKTYQSADVYLDAFQRLAAGLGKMQLVKLLQEARKYLAQHKSSATSGNVNYNDLSMGS